VQATSLRFDARELDHLGPLFGLGGDEFAEIGRREGKLSATFVGKPRLYFILRSARAALISLLSLSTISAGVYARP
jgi:hypothetical protein